MKKTIPSAATLMFTLLFAFSILVTPKTRSEGELGKTTDGRGQFSPFEPSYSDLMDRLNMNDRVQPDSSQNQSLKNWQSTLQEDTQRSLSDNSCQGPTGTSADGNASQSVPAIDGRIFLGGEPPYGYLPTYSPKGSGLPVIPLEPLN